MDRRATRASSNLIGSHSKRPASLVRLPRRQHAELMAVWVCHDHPADVALVDVYASCPKRDETVDLRLLIGVGGRSDVEVHAIPGPGPRHQWRTAPADLRTTV